MSERNEEAADLESKISELENQVQQLQLASAQYEGKVDSIEKSQFLVSQSYAATYDSSLLWYSVIISVIGLLVAVSGVIGFVLIKNYKKREVNQVIDEAETSLKERLSNNEQMAAYLSAGLKSEDFNKTLDSMKSSLFNELSRDLKSFLDDEVNKKRSDPLAHPDKDEIDFLSDSEGRKD
ncbi:hypothetical protein [Idiomarina aminovorans]|uniref:hypothetical protein n=1 Tax=Idiomarina aminovorans TaxID=2914829 RepID=UPI002005384E|nr:hypothetical protein [Idiomarina sp. ATCH4]MCK7459117.1 hypothetical protein [Idiomarina sp. ATCH4]